MVYSLPPTVSLSFVFDTQEIKFEPNIMCERIDKKASFRASQVYIIDDLLQIFFIARFQMWLNTFFGHCLCSMVVLCSKLLPDFLYRLISSFIFFFQLEDGDIICFQKFSQVGSSDQTRYPNVPSFLEYVHNRQV